MRANCKQKRIFGPKKDKGLGKGKMGDWMVKIPSSEANKKYWLFDAKKNFFSFKSGRREYAYYTPVIAIARNNVDMLW